jgi:glycosyltransferase involved in cell wall biosynthesis
MVEKMSDSLMKVELRPAPDGPILAVIPAFDEDRFIASVVLKTRRYVDEVIVVDDGSADETALLARESGATVVRQPHNSGKAAALNVGLALARERRAQAVVMLDGDGQHDPADIPAMLRPILEQGIDMVVGTRFKGVESNTPTWRVAGQQALTAATNFASGVELSDSQNGFRALSQKAILAMEFRTSGFSVESEMQFLVKRHNLTVSEVPIAVNYDEKPKRNPIAHGLQVLNGILKMIGQHRPLLFFGIPGMTIVLIGLYLGLVVVENYYRYSTTQGNAALAIGTALVSITLILIGVFTIFTGIILHTIRAYLMR